MVAIHRIGVPMLYPHLNKFTLINRVMMDEGRLGLQLNLSQKENHNETLNYNLLSNMQN